MLEPFLALRFHFCPRLWRCGIRLQGQIIKVGTDSNSKTAVVVVDERKPILRQITSHGELSDVHLLDAQFAPIVSLPVSIAAQEQTGQNHLDERP